MFFLKTNSHLIKFILFEVQKNLSLRFGKEKNLMMKYLKHIHMTTMKMLKMMITLLMKFTVNQLAKKIQYQTNNQLKANTIIHATNAEEN